MSKSSISLARKKELEKPDEIIGLLQRIFQIIVENKNQISIGFGIFLVLLVGVIGIRSYLNNAEKNASTMLWESLNTYQSALNDKKGQGGALKEVEDDFQLIFGKYSRTTSGKVAQIHFARICYNAGNYEKAILHYQKALESFNKSSTFKAFILNGLAYSYEAVKDKESAIKYFNEASALPETLLKDETLFNLGRIYSETEEKEKSIESYKKIISDYQDSIYYNLVKEIVPG